MKIISWIWENILFLLTLFLLVFIPLYPKLPIVNVRNTWVYVRLEDFVVLFALLALGILIFRKKITLRTPLTMPILIFWIAGAVATIHAVLLIFPTLPNVFPNVAFLSMLRRIEYMSVFFIAFAGMKDKRFLNYVVGALIITLIGVVFYGFGQKFLGFPAYLTMNEEYAKGIPIQISSLARIPSTFGGQYDLAAYLVLILPILMSMVFGYRNILARIPLLGSVALGFILLGMTVSRVSFFALLISFAVVLFMQKKKFVVFALPIVAALLGVLLLSFSSSLINRFGSTVKDVDILVDAKTGDVIGQIKQSPSDIFQKKTVEIKHFTSLGDINTAVREDEYTFPSTSSAILLFSSIPHQVTLVVPPDTPTGENLPQGTGYINLTLSPVLKKLGEFYYQKPPPKGATESAKAFVFYGEFLVKRAAAYDLSFTTRFQGEWPHAIEAFRRNVLFGSGYASISLAVDNDYLRILGEVGLMGFVTFIAIFLSIGIYIKKLLPKIDSPLARSFVVGFAASVIGLMINAVLIDVFEASKVAFVLWLLTGITIGVLHFYQKEHIDLIKDIKNIVTSKYAVITYIGIVALLVFSPMIGNYFVGDDYTWLRWAADCGNASLSRGCPSVISQILHYLTSSDGFFYRPGTKIYFFLMYSLFWLNQTVYHAVSIFLHFFIVVLMFLLIKKILRDTKLSVLAGFLFLILSGYSEVVFWISSTGSLFNALFIVLSLLFFIQWTEKKRGIYFILSITTFIFSLLFHELGIVVPLLIIAYQLTMQDTFNIRIILKNLRYYIVLFIPILFYAAIRYLAQSHWFSGDYSYNLLKLPFNIVGNAIGYVLLTAFGPASLSFYEKLRGFSKEHILVAVPLVLIVFGILYGAYKMGIKRLEKEERKIVIFGLLFFIIALLPFLGLGNIASRYSYLASFGLILVFVFFIKKLYNYLLSSGKDTALSVVVTIISIFCLLHIIQVQQIHGDWNNAGQKANNFLIAIDGAYTDYWSKESMQFHFVNVPIRVGEAWVFPVGIKDALWFVFRNPDIHIYQHLTLKEAFDAVQGSENEKIFVFNDDGGVVEKKKPRKDINLKQNYPSNNTGIKQSK